MDGIAGAKTIAAIEVMERQYIHATKPDGRIDPNGPTLRALNHTRKALAPSHSAAQPHHAPQAHAPAAPAPAPRPVARVPSPPHRAAKPAASHARTGKNVIPQEVIAAAQASQRRWKVPSSITIAQWSLESGWGKRMPRGSNNSFGIKPFRVFNSLEEAFDEHGRFLATHPAYKKARAHGSNPDAYADALTGTYATADDYGAMLKGQMRHYDMYQYDL